MTIDINCHRVTGYRVTDIKTSPTGGAIWRDIIIDMAGGEKAEIAIFALDRDASNLREKEPIADWETEISIIDTGHGEIEYVPAGFDIEQETYEAEPYSWGGSRGSETSTIATLKWIKIGGLKLSAQQVLEMVGAEEYDAIEDRAATKYLEENR